jgi:hypothetical protein
MSTRTPSPAPPGRSSGRTALMALGALVLLGGLACVVVGLARFADAQDEFSGQGGNGPFAMFALGGLAMVVGLGIVAFTRARAMTRDGAYARVTIEQGVPPAGGRHCSGCGRPVDSRARFCESCGTAVG